MAKETKIERRKIEPGRFFTRHGHPGDVFIVEDNVPPRATLVITGGARLVVKGNIEAGAKVIVTPYGQHRDLDAVQKHIALVLNKGPVNTPHLENGAWIARESFNAAASCTLIVEGRLDLLAQIAACGDVRVRGTADTYVSIMTMGSVHMPCIGERGSITAGHEVVVPAVGAHTTIKTWGSAKLELLGAGSSVRAGEISPPRERGGLTPANVHDIYVGRKTTALSTGAKAARLRRM